MLVVTESITCPYCWQRVEVTLDLSVAGQQYVEDCFVCCRPIVIRYRSDSGMVVELSAVRETE